MEANFAFQLSIDVSEALENNEDPFIIDTASLLVCNGFSKPVMLLGQVDECVDCPLQKLAADPIDPGDVIELALSSIYPYRLEIQPKKQTSAAPTLRSPLGFESCSLHVQLEEYGKYVWNVGNHSNCGGLPASSGDSFCEWRQIKAGSSSLIPLTVFFCVVFVLFPLLFLCARMLLKALALRSPTIHSMIISATCFLADPRNPHNFVSQNATKEVNGPQKRDSVRVLCVDVLRGSAIVVMILWRYGTGNYAILDHAVWEGVHLSDWACPCFVFVMGISIAITNRRDASRIFEAINAPSNASEAKTTRSKAKYLKRGALEFIQLIYRIVWRSLLLFAIGLILSNFSISDDEVFEDIRIFGVLQRLSLTYMFTVLATLPVFLRYARQYKGYSQFTGHFWDVTCFWPEWIPILTLAALQTGLELGINPANWNSPDVASMKSCPRGYLGPGGLHWNRSYPDCTGGAHRLLDLYFLGEYHLDDYSTAVQVYKSRSAFEENGLLGTCCSVLLCYLGLQAGKVLLFSRSDRERAVRWTAWAVLFALLTSILTFTPSPYPFNSALIPINYTLWYQLLNILIYNLFFSIKYLLYCTLLP